MFTTIGRWLSHTWSEHCRLLRTYALYRAAVIVIVQVVLTGRVSLERLANVLVTALMTYATAGDETGDQWAPSY